MKLVARCLAALAVLAFATPALPCGDKATKTTTAEKSDREKMEKEKASSTVAKSGAAAKKGGQAKQEQKPATAGM
jgi:hypothetical protein